MILEHLCIAVPFALAVSGVLDRSLTLVLYILTLLIGAICHTRLAMSIQNIAQVSTLRLDERQRATRDQAFALSLRSLGLLLTAAWVYAMTAGLFGWWLPEAKSLGFVLWGFGMMVYSLPTAIAAWTEPDPMLESD